MTFGALSYNGCVVPCEIWPSLCAFIKVSVNSCDLDDQGGFLWYLLKVEKYLLLHKNLHNPPAIASSPSLTLA
jgi:hypothetical protein